MFSLPLPNIKYNVFNYNRLLNFTTGVPCNANTDNEMSKEQGSISHG